MNGDDFFDGLFMVLLKTSLWITSHYWDLVLYVKTVCSGDSCGFLVLNGFWFFFDFMILLMTFFLVDSGSWFFECS